jgi:hypothetical protein
MWYVAHLLVSKVEVSTSCMGRHNSSQVWVVVFCMLLTGCQSPVLLLRCCMLLHMAPEMR